jgi:hypothetical protein
MQKKAQTPLLEWLETYWPYRREKVLKMKGVQYFIRGSQKTGEITAKLLERTANELVFQGANSRLVAKIAY